MKTENTLENKAKFFAQYWGQHLIIMGSFLRIINHVTLCNIENDDILQLKPFSKITETDLFEVLKNSDEKYNDKEYGKLIRVENIEMENYFDLSCKMICEKKNYKLFTNIFYEAAKVDGLRKLGYAAPWLDLSIEDLQEYGWIKLEE